MATSRVQAWSRGMRAAVTAPVTAWSHAATSVTQTALRAVLPGVRG